MSLDDYEPTLEQCAETGQIDYEKWPAIVEPLLERLSHIAYNDFPIPRPYPIINPVLPSQRSSNPDRFIEHPPTVPSQNPTTPTTPRNLPPVPPFPSTDVSRVPDSQAAPPNTQNSQDQQNSQRPQLPQEILQVLNGALTSLRTSFSQKPPHTVQRLIELALHPTKHYRTLPAWLRALDRVVSVSSGADIFPLSDIPPTLTINNTNNGINGTDPSSIGGGILFTTNKSSNETRNGYDIDALGSDESLGGALLTPIPWLKESTTDHSDNNDGDNPLDNSNTDPTDESADMLSARSKVASWQDRDDAIDEDDFIGDPIIDTSATISDAQAIAAVAEEHANNGVGDRKGVTQGELIRMEQEAGVVPVPHEDIGRIGPEDGEFGMGFGSGEDEEEGNVHARGPDMVGTVDMGLVGGVQREVRISSPPRAGERGVNANDAQEVLKGGVSRTAPKSDGNEEDEEFVHVGKGEDGDTTTGSTVGKKDDDGVDKGQSGEDKDGDIVLVDADGVPDNEEEKKADESGVNFGADASDTTTQ